MAANTGRRTKVLVVSPLDIFPPNTGGMSRTHGIIKSLLPQHDVALVCPALAQPEAVDLPVRLYPIGQPGRSQFVSPQFARKLRTVIRSEAPDVILASFVWTVPAVLLARLPKRIPVWLDTQNVESDRLRGAGSRWWRLAALFERVATSVVDGVFVVSEDDGRRLVELGTPARKVGLLPNGYDDDRFAPDSEAGWTMRRALGIGDHELVLLYFGHLGYAPNQEALQLLHRHVLPVLDRHGAEYRLLIAGRGSDELREQYNHPRMRFLGVVDRIEDAISAADAVVVPLVRGGGTRTKIIESIACAKPVVSTAAGAAGLDRSACGDLLTVVDGWDAFACATLAAARPGAPREVPASFRDVYAWSAIGRRIRFDDARTEAPLRSRGG